MVASPNTHGTTTHTVPNAKKKGLEPLLLATNHLHNPLFSYRYDMLRGSTRLASASARSLKLERKGGRAPAMLLGFRKCTERCKALSTDLAGDSEARMACRTTHVILDLDGTLLDTERLVEEVYETIVRGDYGKIWDGRGAQERLGLRPLESVAKVIAEYELPCTPAEMLARRTELLHPKLAHAAPLPGADRLIRHLARHGVPVAVATSSPYSSTRVKLGSQAGWADALASVVAGDEVEKGKPAPDIFLEAARRLNADPASCLVVEDSPHGVTAAKAAGMEVIAVPSLPTKAARPLYAHADHILSSLLDLQLEQWGLPPFRDWIGRALPVPPWRVGGPVIKGYGRGSKILGIPTANLPTMAFSGALAEQVCGVYLGWAGLADKGVYKMVMSVGWNPYFDNAEKTVEPWLLHDFPDDFYGEELRLVVVGYIRAEANFPSLESLIERIHEDGRIAEAALDLPLLGIQKRSLLDDGPCSKIVVYLDHSFDNIPFIPTQWILLLTTSLLFQLAYWCFWLIDCVPLPGIPTPSMATSSVKGPLHT